MLCYTHTHYSWPDLRTLSSVNILPRPLKWSQVVQFCEVFDLFIFNRTELGSLRNALRLTKKEKEVCRMLQQGLLVFLCAIEHVFFEVRLQRRVRGCTNCKETWLWRWQALHAGYRLRSFISPRWITCSLWLRIAVWPSSVKCSQALSSKATHHMNAEHERVFSFRRRSFRSTAPDFHTRGLSRQ